MRNIQLNEMKKKRALIGKAEAGQRRTLQNNWSPPFVRFFPSFIIFKIYVNFGILLYLHVVFDRLTWDEEKKYRTNCTKIQILNVLIEFYLLIRFSLMLI